MAKKCLAKIFVDITYLIWQLNSSLINPDVTTVNNKNKNASLGK